MGCIRSERECPKSREILRMRIGTSSQFGVKPALFEICGMALHWKRCAPLGDRPAQWCLVPAREEAFLKASGEYLILDTDSYITILLINLDTIGYHFLSRFEFYTRKQMSAGKPR